MSTENKVFITPEGEHNYNKPYEKYSIVTHTQNEVIKAYIAIKDVPPFVSILDTNYWKFLNSDVSNIDLSSMPKIVKPSVDGKPTHMTSDEIAGLKVGDVIVSQTLTGNVNFYVTKITGDGSGSIVYAVNVNGDRVVTMTFINTNGTWAYQDSSTLYITTKLVNALSQSGMLPNTLYNLGELATDTTFVMSAAEDNTIANVWTWTFSTGSTVPTITWPAQITMWSDAKAPEIEANKYYEVSVMNGVGTIISADIPETNVEP